MANLLAGWLDKCDPFFLLPGGGLARFSGGVWGSQTAVKSCKLLTNIPPPFFRLHTGPELTHRILFEDKEQQQQQQQWAPVTTNTIIYSKVSFSQKYAPSRGEIARTRILRGPLIELNCCYWVEEGRGGLIRLSWAEIWHFFLLLQTDVAHTIGEADCKLGNSGRLFTLSKAAVVWLIAGKKRAKKKEQNKPPEIVGRCHLSTSLKVEVTHAQPCLLVWLFGWVCRFGGWNNNTQTIVCP